MPLIMAVNYRSPVPTSEIEEDTAQLSVLADAIKKMEGMIGDYRPSSPDPAVPVLSSNPTVLAIVEYCEQLGKLMTQLQQQELEVESERSQSPVPPHPRECVPPSIQDLIISWLGGINLEEFQQLSHDKEELLSQVVSLQQQLETSRGDCSKLSAKVGNVEKRCVEKDQQLREMKEELRLVKISLSTKEVELRHLQGQIQAGYRSNTKKKVSFDAQENSSNRKSFRKALKAFWKKDRDSATLEGGATLLPHPVNLRADAFNEKDHEELADWFKSIGLDMYSDLVQEKMLTGLKLSELVAEDGSLQLVQIGILSTLHCKKLKLAVMEALSEHPSPLSELDHNWVANWLLDIGLPQFQRTFMDARFDGRMLNDITVDDLKLLDITVPFHISSIKRALQALRMCAYNKDYLKGNSVDKSHGSQKLLHWSAKDVVQWVCTIELDEYVTAMDTAGIHGAIMLLDVQFSSESLARALGINQSKTLIRKHLSKKFMELIGPVAAQNKVDAMQCKTYVPLDPTEAPSGFSRGRSRSVGHKRGKTKGAAQTLLPLEQFPAATSAVPTAPATGDDDLSSASTPTRYPTP